MRLHYSAAALMLGLGATVAAAAPASAATAPVCSFSPTTGAGLVTTTLDSPGVYRGNFFYGSPPSCSPYPAQWHWSGTLHYKLNGVAQPDFSFSKDCTSPDPIMCLPFSVASVTGLKCDVSYSYETWVSETGWYRATATSAQVTIDPVTGPHKTGTTFDPAVCG